MNESNHDKARSVSQQTKEKTVGRNNILEGGTVRGFESCEEAPRNSSPIAEASIGSPALHGKKSSRCLTIANGTNPCNRNVAGMVTTNGANAPQDRGDLDSASFSWTAHRGDPTSFHVHGEKKFDIISKAIITATEENHERGMKDIDHPNGEDSCDQTNNNNTRTHIMSFDRFNWSTVACPQQQPHIGARAPSSVGSKAYGASSQQRWNLTSKDLFHGDHRGLKSRDKNVWDVSATIPMSSISSNPSVGPVKKFLGDNQSKTKIPPCRENALLPSTSFLTIPQAIALMQHNNLQSGPNKRKFRSYNLSCAYKWNAFPSRYRYYQRQPPMFPSAKEIAESIPPNASSICHIFDRRIDLDKLERDSSIYELLRSWVRDDPYRRPEYSREIKNFMDHQDGWDEYCTRMRSRKVEEDHTLKRRIQEYERMKREWDQDFAQNATAQSSPTTNTTDNTQTCNVLDSTLLSGETLMRCGSTTSASASDDTKDHFRKFVESAARKRKQKAKIMKKRDEICLMRLQKAMGINVQKNPT